MKLEFYDLFRTIEEADMVLEKKFIIPLLDNNISIFPRLKRLIVPLILPETTPTSQSLSRRKIIYRYHHEGI